MDSLYYLTAHWHRCQFAGRWEPSHTFPRGFITFRHCCYLVRCFFQIFLQSVMKGSHCCCFSSACFHSIPQIIGKNANQTFFFLIVSYLEEERDDVSYCYRFFSHCTHVPNKNSFNFEKFDLLLWKFPDIWYNSTCSSLLHAWKPLHGSPITSLSHEYKKQL